MGTEHGAVQKLNGVYFLSESQLSAWVWRPRPTIALVYIGFYSVFKCFPGWNHVLQRLWVPKLRGIVCGWPGYRVFALYFACLFMQFTGEPLAGAQAFYRFPESSTTANQSQEVSPVYRLYRSRDAGQGLVEWWRSSRRTRGGSRQHRRGRRAGRRHQQRQAGRPDQSPRPLPDYERVVIQLPPRPDRETTQITGHVSGGPGCLDIEAGRLRHGDVIEDPPPRQSSSRNDSHPEQHRVPAPPPPERACDAGEGISVRVERRPGPWPCDVRTPRYLISPKGGIVHLYSLSW